MAEQYTNIRVVLDKITRHPLLTDITLEAAVDYCVDFMRIVGVPKMFEDKTQKIRLKDYKGILPVDWVETNQIKYEGTPMRSSTDTFHMSTNKDGGADRTFVVQGNYIHTTEETGEIEISYKGIATDADGYPMLPDNSNFTRALEQYIKLQYFTILFDLGKISGAVYSNTQQQYAWAVGSCTTDMLRLDLSKAESFFNSFRTLLPRVNEFHNSFKNNGSRERLKQY